MKWARLTWAINSIIFSIIFRCHSFGCCFRRYFVCRRDFDIYYLPKKKVPTSPTCPTIIAGANLELRTLGNSTRMCKHKQKIKPCRRRGEVSRRAKGGNPGFYLLDCSDASKRLNARESRRFWCWCAVAAAEQVQIHNSRISVGFVTMAFV